MLHAPLALAATSGEAGLGAGSSNLIEAAARTCKEVSSCEEAVQIWCGGYRRADADKDGIPCENICHSKEQVDQIREKIGC